MEILTPKEVAEILNISVEYVYKLMRNNELPNIKIGRLRRIYKSDLEEFAKSRYNACYDTKARTQ